MLQSKGGILSKACDYIKELGQSNDKLREDISTLDRLKMDNQLLRQEVQASYVTLWEMVNPSKVVMLMLCIVACFQVEDWKAKNQNLRNLLRQHGIVGASNTDPQWSCRANSCGGILDCLGQINIKMRLFTLRDQVCMKG